MEDKIKVLSALKKQLDLMLEISIISLNEGTKTSKAINDLCEADIDYMWSKFNKYRRHLMGNMIDNDIQPIKKYKPKIYHMPTDLSICPKCGGETTTYRHPYAKIWCRNCGHVLREEGQRGR